MKKFKALLINPYIEDFTAYDLWIRPLGLYKLSFALKKLNFDVEMIDLLDMSHPSIPKKFKKRRENGTGKIYFEYISKPKILPNIERRFKRYGIPISLFKDKLKKIKGVQIIFLTSIMTYWYTGVEKTIEILRDQMGNIPIILGGIYPSLLFEHAKKRGADLVIKGSFEKSLPNLLKEIFECDFLYDFEIYPDYEISWDKKSLVVQTSKGCPKICKWCASKLIDPEFFQLSHKYLLKVFEKLKKLGTKNIAFYDDALLYKKDLHLKILLKKLKEKKLNFNFHTPNGIDLNDIDEEIIKLFKETNFKTIRLSVDLLNKKISYEKLKEVSKMFFKNGFKAGEIEAYLLIGFPEQSFEEIKEELYILKELKIISRFAYFSPIEGTKEWEILKEKGYVKDGEDPLLSNKLLFPIRFNGINTEELKDLKKIQNLLNNEILSNALKNF